MKQIKKIFLPLILIFIFFLVFSDTAIAQVNIITNKDHAGFADNQNLDQTIVYAPSPSDVQGIVEVCQQSQVCVIRGHTNWTNDGNTAIAGQASAIAQKWADTLDQAAAQLGKVVYFEPWNEPMRRDLECNNLSVEQCASRVAEYIQLLRNNITSSKVRITSPAIDMHHPETQTFFNAWGASFANSFDVYSIHIYAPDIACSSGERYFKNQLSNYGLSVGSKRFIITESGALNEGNYGSPVYDDKPLCEFYCNDCGGQTLVESWIGDNQILGYALFSYGPEGISWNLWAADCVKNALQGTCDCSACQEAETGDLNMIDEAWGRKGRTPDPREGFFGIGIFGGATTPNNDQSFLQQLLTSFQDFFKTSQGTYAPSHKNGEYPGDDSYRDYYRRNRIITLPGTIAEVCLPGRDIKQKVRFFPDHHNPDEVVVELLNLTGQNHRVAQSLQAYLDIYHWASGSVFDDDREFIDADNNQGRQELARRGMDLRGGAGHQTKAMPGEYYEEKINDEFDDFYASSVGLPQQNEEIVVQDQPIVFMGDGGMTKKDEEHTEELPDGRKVLTTDGSWEVKGSIFACCNPSHFEGKPYTYEQACSHFNTDWVCSGGESVVPDDVQYGRYAQGKYIADYFTGGGDLPTYYETCYEMIEEEGRKQTQIFNNFFVNMSPSDRYQAFPVDEKEDRYTVKKGENEYWACQITKIYLPQGLSALNACDKMMENELPGEVYENLLSNEPDKKEFPCDMGNLPYTDGPTTNIDAKRSSSTFGQLFEQLLGFVTRKEVDSCEVSYDTYTETEIIIDPETGEEREQTVEKQVANYCERDYEIKAKSSLIIPFYQKFEQCAKFLYGYLDGEATEQLHAEIKEKVGKEDTDPYNLFEIARGNDSGINSGGAESDNRREHYEQEADEFKVKSDLGGDDFKLPGGGADFAEEAASSGFYPGEIQNQIGI